jgi:hypothetical protein
MARATGSVARAVADIATTQPRRWVSRHHLWILVSGTAAAAIALFAVTHVHLNDMDAYWNAAIRIRSGEPVYAVGANPDASEVYRYAPWFAFAWVPLTFLPYPLVQTAWLVLLLVATAWVSLNVARDHLPIALIGGSLLLVTCAYGNVHPLLVAGLWFGVSRPSGPLWVAAAASLKAAPILLVMVYLGRREWAKLTATMGVFALLVAPMLVLPGYSPNPGLTLSLYGWSPPLYVGLAVFTAGLAILMARTPWAWLAGAVAVIAALPRLLLYDFSFLMLRSPRVRSDVVPERPER